MTFLFSESSSNFNFLTAKRCESVAVHINSLSCISQLTPVSTGRVSEVDTAKFVCAMIFLILLLIIGLHHHVILEVVMDIDRDLNHLS